MSMNTIELNVNGKKYSLPVIEGEMLSDLLRERLRLSGTKIGCNESECGACTVVVDGEPVLSCSYPAVRAHGKNILTIEGLAKKVGDNGNSYTVLHPLQEAFIEYGAVQCGFCIPGQIMTSYALLEKNPTPSVNEIKYALKDTLCRCAGYPSIIGAIQAASASIVEKSPIAPPFVQIANSGKRMVGQVSARSDGIAKVTGTAIYSDDIQFAGMLHARVKRAMVPAGVLQRLDISAAIELPGVHAVITAEDVPNEKMHGLFIKDWPVLIGIGDQIRYVGDALAVIAADTREIATQALDLIQLEIEPLPIVSSAVQAHLPDTRKIHETGNLLKHIKVYKGDLSEGFAEADVILEHSYFTNPNDHAFIEPECSIATLTDEGKLEIYVGSQIPYSDREQVAAVLGLPENKVRIIGQLIGGGFGGKEDIAGQIHAALLTMKTGKPVKLLFDRHESLLVHPKRHATQINIKVGAKKDGKLVAVQTELHGDTGAYASLGEKVMTRATTHSSGPYEVPNVKIDCYAMYTNNPPAGAFRGFGVMQSAFAVESIMDTLAERLQLDPIEIRKQNALRVGSVTNTGQLLRDSVGLMECIEKVEKALHKKAGTNPFEPMVDPSDPTIVRSWGFAVAYKNTGLGGGAPDKAGAEVELLPTGHFQVRSASAELGQGLPTVLQLIAAEELGQGADQIEVLLSDTDLTPDGGPTTASRQTYVTGNAVKFASKAMKDLLTSELAERYDVSPENIEFKEGLAQVDKNQIALSTISQNLRNDGITPTVLYTYWAPETKPLGEGGDMHVAFSFAAQAALVEVNTATGEVKVPEVIVANDVGFAINPLGLNGQVEGGIVMGIGHALVEDFILEEGVVITDRLAKYRIPSIYYSPKITSFIVEHPSSDGPYGAKGIGEICLIPTIPAITNAIYNAVGVRVNKLPVDQEQIVLELEKRKELSY
ncbi:MAG TPA: molybdopterin cofactor-binding domain-containing protein [Anaerolineaceae bacterium]|nr:molybdopterin cofactor-binding domain-containing protein [Anaerolineaceae bacterium]